MNMLNNKVLIGRIPWLLNFCFKKILLIYYKKVSRILFINNIYSININLKSFKNIYSIDGNILNF